MENPFDSPRMLFEDANERIAGLEGIITAFTGHDGRTYGSDFDAKNGKHLLYVQFPISIPLKIRIEIQAIARGLRDALDHAVYSSAIAIFGGEPTKTKFLVADTPEGIQEDIKRNKCKDVHRDIIAYMVHENACETGNKTIWSLNQFRNKNSHRVVSPANAGAAGFGINHMSGAATFDSMNEWRSTSRRLYYAKVTPHGKELNLDINPLVEIHIHSQFGLGQKSAVQELRIVASEVARIIGRIENETARVLSF